MKGKERKGKERHRECVSSERGRANLLFPWNPAPFPQSLGLSKMWPKSPAKISTLFIHYNNNKQNHKIYFSLLFHPQPRTWKPFPSLPAPTKSVLPQKRKKKKKTSVFTQRCWQKGFLGLIILLYWSKNQFFIDSWTNWVLAFPEFPSNSSNSRL